jgi:hypothetical protein
MASDDDIHRVRIEKWERRPTGHPIVPLIAERHLAHFPDLREFLQATSSRQNESSSHPVRVKVGERFYKLSLAYRSDSAAPIGIRVAALIPTRQPLHDDQADNDLWTILQWMITRARQWWKYDDGDRGPEACQHNPETGHDAVPLHSVAPDSCKTVARQLRSRRSVELAKLHAALSLRASDG